MITYTKYFLSKLKNKPNAIIEMDGELVCFKAKKEFIRTIPATETEPKREVTVKPITQERLKKLLDGNYDAGLDPTGKQRKVGVWTKHLVEKDSKNEQHKGVQKPKTTTGLKATSDK